MDHRKYGKYLFYTAYGLQNPIRYIFCKGTHGVIVNKVTLPKHQQIPIQNMDIIVFGLGNRYTYTFHVQSDSSEVGE